MGLYVEKKVIFTIAPLQLREEFWWLFGIDNCHHKSQTVDENIEKINETVH